MGMRHRVEEDLTVAGVVATKMRQRRRTPVTKSTEAEVVDREAPWLAHEHNEERGGSKSTERIPGLHTSTTKRAAVDRQRRSR
jgi:hypothetical protein